MISIRCLCKSRRYYNFIMYIFAVVERTYCSTWTLIYFIIDSYECIKKKGWRVKKNPCDFKTPAYHLPDVRWVCEKSGCLKRRIMPFYASICSIFVRSKNQLYSICLFTQKRVMRRIFGAHFPLLSSIFFILILNKYT